MQSNIPSFLQIRITHENGTTIYDPNSIIMALVEKGEPTELWKPQAGGEGSLISGAPAVRFETDEVSVLLTPDELGRLVWRNLRPEEFKSLQAACGIFHDIHDDFYDPETGEALQPRGM